MVVSAATDPFMWKAVLKNDHVRTFLRQELHLEDDSRSNVDDPAPAHYGYADHGTATRNPFERLSSLLCSMWAKLQESFGCSRPHTDTDLAHRAAVHGEDDSEIRNHDEEFITNHAFAIALISIIVAIAARLNVKMFAKNVDA